MESRIFLRDVYKITGIGIVCAGKVNSGIFKTRMKTDIGNKIMVVKIIEKNHTSINEANVGDDVGFMLLNADYNLLKSKINKELVFQISEGSEQQVHFSDENRSANHPQGPIKSLFSKWFGR